MDWPAGWTSRSVSPPALPSTATTWVLPGALPAGRYASLTYVNHARRANRSLVEWIRDTGHTPDRADPPKGDAFTCRYEVYLTDPRTQRMKTKWLVRLDIRLA